MILLAPIKLDGVAGSSGDLPFDLSKIREDGYQITYSSPSGELWRVSSPTFEEEREQRVVLVEDGWSGGFASADFSEADSVNRFGSRVIGHTYKPMQGSLSVVVRDEPWALGHTLENFRMSWDELETGKLTVVNRNGLSAWANVSLAGFSDPTRSPRGLRMIDLDVDWMCREGHWWGSSIEYSGVATVVAPGDSKLLPPSCSLRWDTSVSSTSVTFPHGQTLTLSAARDDGLRFIDLDRGMMGHVTREDGSTDSQLWSSLLGRVAGVDLVPHEKTSWVLGDGLTLEVKPRLRSPWR